MLRKKVGKQGEKIAAQYYRKLGWQIITQNFWTRYGELDLVLQKDKQILLVEVKTRHNHAFGWAEESINEEKLLKMQLTYEILKNTLGLPDFYQIEICIIEKNANQTIIKTIKI